MKPIDLSFKNNKDPKNGNILISDPFLDEDFFRRSVILMCDHTSEGSFGFVLNHYLDVDLHTLDNDFPDINARISVGGPVDTQSLYFIHALGDRLGGSSPITGDLMFGGDYTELLKLLEEDNSVKDKVRFFLGYSGWGKDQLGEELKENSWLVATNIKDKEILSTADNDFWKSCLEKQGERFKTISKFPLNPNEN